MDKSAHWRAVKCSCFCYNGGGVSTNFNSNVPAVLNIEQFAMLYHKKVIDKIIIPRDVYFETQKFSLTTLRKYDVNIADVVVAGRIGSMIDLLTFLEPYPSARYLPHMEFRIAEHCNLNCKMCTEYCALVTKPTFMSFEKFTRDFSQLRKFIDDFGAIRILGGEPLLNPEVGKYVKFCRELYPITPLHLVTNAILLPKMSDEFFDTVRENDVEICISFYPPMQSKMPQIQQLLDQKRVRYNIGSLVNIFSKNQVLERHNFAEQVFKGCGWSQCHNFCDGKIAACFKPFVTKYFNAYYHKDLPEDGAIDLYSEGLTTEKLKAQLLKPFDRCSYCTNSLGYSWGTVSHLSPISDWVIEN